MFTGIIQEMGAVADLGTSGGGLHITIEARATASALHIGDSIAVNGVCQTVVAREEYTFSVQAVEETLAKTTLSGLSQGDRVNLETAVRLGDPMGGHLVQGHVDGVGRVISIARLDSSWLVEIGIPEHLTRYVIPVGSIAVDGVSLTVARLSGSRLTIAVIPHTLEQTTLGTLAPGRKVNIECDLVGKYVERLVRAYAPPGSGELSEDLLRRWGYGSGTA